MTFDLRETLFYRQAELLLRIVPYFVDEKKFALKGGTAINFFVRDLPRLSVDIDLAYLPFNERKEALEDISDTLVRVSENIRKHFPGTTIILKHLKGVKTISGFIVRRGDVSIKVEPNLVIRGFVYPPAKRKICAQAEKLFERSFIIQTLSFAELYGGKICAALDRQHPRDLFDIDILLKNEGITEDIRKAFIVSLISHPRPMIELLSPNLLDLKQGLTTEFLGMTLTQVSVEQLEQVRERLIHLIKEEMTEKERLFIFSVKKMEPLWELLGLENVENLPAVKWKLQNLKKMDKTKHHKAVDKLRAFLDI